MKPKEIKIRKVLKKLGIAPNLSGYFYLIDAITMVHENKKKYMMAIVDLYTDVARKYNQTMPRVEKGIRNAISKIDIELFKQTFGYNGKMNNGVFIYMVADELDTVELEDENTVELLIENIKVKEDE